MDVRLVLFAFTTRLTHRSTIAFPISFVSTLDARFELVVVFFNVEMLRFLAALFALVIVEIEIHSSKGNFSKSSSFIASSLS